MSQWATWAPPGGEHPKRVRASAKTCRQTPTWWSLEAATYCGLEGDEGCWQCQAILDSHASVDLRRRPGSRVKRCPGRRMHPEP